MLSARGHDAFHVTTVGLRNASDTAVWDYAVAEGAVILTKDEDFALRRMRVKAGPTVVWLRLGNCSNTMLQNWLMPLMPEIERLSVTDDVLIEVR